jgi:inorganic triphosphatase YgiF
MAENHQHPIENELKLELPDAAALARLRVHLGPPDWAILQRNLYFDCADGRWTRARWALRLRLSTSRAWLTIKGDAKSEAGWTQRPELECELPLDQANAAARDLERLRKLATRLAAGRIDARLLAEPLVPRGELTTLRMCYRRAEGRAELALDRTQYPGGVDVHELELECRDPRAARAEEAWLRALLAELSIEWKPSALSKLARLLQSTAPQDENERGR